jgi:glutamate/tyrosine decarboxylase-like PLP-dependent enzyme
MERLRFWPGVTPEELAGMARADSLALDPHKWLYIPVNAGLVLERDGEAMRAAFSLYLPTCAPAAIPG